MIVGRRLRRLLLLSGSVLGAIAVTLVTGAFIYEQAAAWRDSRVMKRAGRSVDIGGRTLNIQCSGDGSPTVILESGRSSPGYVWVPSHRAIATFTRACWYDRAGLGWSDPGPDPNWGDAPVAPAVSAGGRRTSPAGRPRAARILPLGVDYQLHSIAT